MIPLIAQIGAERLDWFGFGISSANRTAAFIACAIIASWMFAAVFKKIGFWISIVLSLMLFYFLIQTQSRGALVALAIALAIFFAVGKIEYTKSRILVLVAALVVVGCFYFQSSLSTRMSNMAALQSSSANCRADIYLSGIKMLTDAPHGFPPENSPVEIYMRWYQNPDDGESYISMINSHLEFMCAHGFLLRFAYIAFWTFVLAVAFPLNRNALNTAIFATWICFGLCAVFSNVMNYWVLWIIPTTTLVLAIVCNRRRLFSYKFYSAILFTAVIAIAFIYAVSYLLPRDCKLQFKPNGDVLCGDFGSPKYLLFSPVEKTVGTKFGSELVVFCKENNVCVMVSNNVPSNEFDSAIICDIENASELSAIKSKNKILLNPQFNEDFEKSKSEETTIFLGGFSDWRSRKAWRLAANENSRLKVVVLDGVADYVPNWTKFFKDENR
jgi:hypothetical protein vspiD_18365